MPNTQIQINDVSALWKRMGVLLEETQADDASRADHVAAIASLDAKNAARQAAALNLMTEIVHHPAAAALQVILGMREDLPLPPPPPPVPAETEAVDVALDATAAVGDVAGDAPAPAVSTVDDVLVDKAASADEPGSSEAALKPSGLSVATARPTDG